MCVRSLKKAATKKLNISRQAVEARARRIKRKFGPLPDEIAYAIVAHQAGVDVSTVVNDIGVLSSIRDQIDRIAEIESGAPTRKTKTVIKTVTVNIGQNLSLSDPILSDRVLRDAADMTEVYAEIYVFENSVREVISKILTKNIGADWWDTSVNNRLQQKIRNRVNNENKNAWHGRRGAHPIYYTDISDLLSIIQQNWTFFENILPNQEWITVRLNEISLSRNVVDHHNPLKSRDRQRLQLYFKDWQDQIEAYKDSI